MKKLLDSKGMSLIEMMVALLITVLLVVAMGTGISSATKVYQETTFANDANSMANIVNSSITDILRYSMKPRVPADGGSDVSSSGKSFVDDTGASVDTGFVFNCNAYSVNGAYFTVPADGPKKGKVMLKSTRNSELMMDIVNEGAYPGGLEIADFTSTYVPVGADGKAGGYATISYRIVSPDTDRESDPIELCIRFANVK